MVDTAVVLVACVVAPLIGWTTAAYLFRYLRRRDDRKLLELRMTGIVLALRFFADQEDPADSFEVRIRRVRDRYPTEDALLKAYLDWHTERGIVVYKYVPQGPFKG